MLSIFQFFITKCSLKKHIVTLNDRWVVSAGMSLPGGCIQILEYCPRGH